MAARRDNQGLRNCPPRARIARQRFRSTGGLRGLRGSGWPRRVATSKQITKQIYRSAGLAAAPPITDQSRLQSKNFPGQEGGLAPAPRLHILKQAERGQAHLPDLESS